MPKEKDFFGLGRYSDPSLLILFGLASGPKHGYARMEDIKETHMRLNRTLLRLYPRAWRERYEEEMLAVLEQHTITPTTIFDLLLGAIDARLDPHYRSQHSTFSTRDVRLTTTAFVTLLAVFNVALFIWQSLSVPYMDIITADVFTSTGVPVTENPVTGVPVGDNPNGLHVSQTFQLQITPGWSDPGSISSHIAAYSLQIEFLLLLVVLLFLMAHIVKHASSARRIPLILLALASLALPLLALPFLFSAPISPLIPDYITFFQANTSSSLPSTLMVLEIAGSGLFIGLIKGWQAIKARQKGLLTMVGVVIILPALSVFLNRLLTDIMYPTWYDNSLSQFQMLLYTLGASLLPFLGFGALLLALGTDELPKPFLRRSLHYGAMLTIPLIVSLLATIIWNIASWQQLLFSKNSHELQDFVLHMMHSRGFIGNNGLLLCISLSLFTLLLVMGIGTMLKRGYRALSSPPAQENRQQQPSEMMQAQRS